MSQRCPVVRGLSFKLGGAQSTTLSSLRSPECLRQGLKSILFYIQGGTRRVTVCLAFPCTARNTWPLHPRAKKTVQASRWLNSAGKVDGPTGLRIASHEGSGTHLSLHFLPCRLWAPPQGRASPCGYPPSLQWGPAPGGYPPPAVGISPSVSPASQFCSGATRVGAGRD